MKKRYIIMAKDQYAIKAIDYNIAQPDQVLELELPEKEFEFFFNSGLVDEINTACDVMIDNYEDEEIVGRTKLNLALDVLRKHRYTVSNQHFFENLSTIFQEAASKDTAVFFFF